MNKVHTFTINDEPFVDTATGVREATLIYKGGRYVYAEVCTETGKIQAPIHFSDTPDMDTALERLTQMETRQIIVIDADINPIAAAIIEDNHYSIEIENYVEELPNGKTYTHEYSENTRLNEIYDISNMLFDIEKNDFEYRFSTNNISDEVFIESIDSQLAYISDQLEQNSYSDAQMVEINAFKQALLDLKESYDGSVKHWKLDFPTCSVL